MLRTGRADYDRLEDRAPADDVETQACAAAQSPLGGYRASPGQMATLEIMSSKRKEASATLSGQIVAHASTPNTAIDANVVDGRRI